MMLPRFIDAPRPADMASAAIDCVALETGVSRDAILSDCKEPMIAHARQRAQARLYDDGMRMNEIARQFCCHPSSVRHAIHAVAKRKSEASA